MLYVAVTRTKNNIFIPETLMPKMFPVSSMIHVLKVAVEEEKKPANTFITKTKVVSKEFDKVKSYSVEETRNKHKDAYKPWTAELDKQLENLCCEGLEIKELAKQFGRTTGAIRSRITKLRLEALYS